MNTFKDDIRSNFIPRYGAIAEIIVICIVAYVLVAVPGAIMYLFKQGDLYVELYDYLLLPSDLSLLIQRPWTIITHMFMHDAVSPDGVLHIVFNLLWLYWIGRLYREYIGDRAVWHTFFLGALFGAFLAMVAINLLPVFEGKTRFLVGASAGISAIIIAAATLRPNHTYFLIIVGPVRIKWLVLLFVVLDLLALKGDNAGGMIAHVGGYISGFLYVQGRQNGIDLGRPFDWIARLFKRSPKTKSKPKASPIKIVKSNTTAGSKATNAGKPGKPSQQEVDRILDKIQREGGYEKLTREEKQILFDASQE